MAETNPGCADCLPLVLRVWKCTKDLVTMAADVFIALTRVGLREAILTGVVCRLVLAASQPV